MNDIERQALREEADRLWERGKMLKERDLERAAEAVKQAATNLHAKAARR